MKSKEEKAEEKGREYAYANSNGFNRESNERSFIAGAKWMCAACAKDMEREWISVGERLPEKMKDVLLCNINVEKQGVSTVTQGWYNGSNFLSYVTQGKNKLNATHWQPLPPPPQSTEKGGEGECTHEISNKGVCAACGFRMAVEDNFPG